MSDYNAAPYIVDKAKDFKKAIQLGEPNHIYGMYDGGQDYLFTLLSAETPERSQPRSVLFCNTQQGIDFEKIQDFCELPKQGIAISIVFLLSSTELLPPAVQILLASTRATFPWHFSYHFVGYTSVFHLANKDEESLYLRNWTAMKPLSTADSNVVVDILETFYHKTINTQIKNEIALLAGGNPGIIKALCLQAISTDTVTETFIINKKDSNLTERLRHIVEVLSNEQLLSFVEPESATDKVTTFLKEFGYLTDNGIVFSPVLLDYISNSPEVFERVKLIRLPLQLQQLYELFVSKKGEVVKRDEIAVTLWKEKAAEKYSDWAIDRAVADLRKHTENYLTITTLKKNGFLCQT